MTGSRFSTDGAPVWGALAVLTAIAIAVAGMCVMPASDATGEDLTGYGTASEIEISPGYTWSYTARFASDLTEGTVLKFELNELGSYADLSGHNLSITIPENHATGKYNVVLKATHEPTGQVSYQWIRMTVKEAMSLDYSGCLSQIIAGTEQSITLSHSGGIGTVKWSEVSMPAGLTLSGNTITGTPETIGANTIVVKATSSEGESLDLGINFTVYNKIVGGEDQVITGAGTSAASDPIVQTGTDLGVTWKVTSGTLPAGFTLNPSTGVVSGTYTGSSPVSVDVILTGTAANGPAQTATKNLTIRAEPAFTLSGPTQLITYTGKATPTTLDVTPSASVSDIKWGITVLGGLSIDGGTVSVTGLAAVTEGRIITVAATTEYGQTKTHDFVLIVEDTLKITGPTALNATAGRLSTVGPFEVTGGSSNTVTVSDSGPYGNAITYDEDNDRLSITYSTPTSASDVTIKVTSAAGQTATCTVSVTVYSALGFTSQPEASGIYAYVLD